MTTGDDRSPGAPRLRYTRRRVLILGGAFAAGVVGVVAGLRALGGQAVDSVGGALSDQFGPFPVRSIEDVPDVPPEEWTITVDGLVDEPLKIDHATWSSLQRLDETVDFHCVEGWSVDDVRWGGVAPAVLLERAGVRPEGTWVVVHGYTGEYTSSVPIDLVRDSQTVLADTMEGAPLPAKHGGPIRLVVPDQLGYKSVKWVTRLEVTDASRPGYWESRGYPDDAPVTGSAPAGGAPVRSG
jgi:DMSO/TMAO reductase YedYZ molybdopterin-dependent catalytic subunit